MGASYNTTKVQHSRGSQGKITSLSSVQERSFLSCADPEGWGTGGPDPLENHKTMGVLRSTVIDPGKSQSCPVNIKGWSLLKLYTGISCTPDKEI